MTIAPYLLDGPASRRLERRATAWTDAEAYHQNYYKKNPIRYGFYRKACRRDARINELWGDEAHQGVKYGS